MFSLVRHKRSTRLLGSERLMLRSKLLLLPSVLEIPELSLESRPLRLLGSNYCCCWKSRPKACAVGLLVLA